MKLKLTLAFSLIIVIFSFYWLYDHAYIEVAVTNPIDSSNITYSLAPAGTNNPTQVESPDTTKKILLTRGEYEVFVEQAGHSSFSIQEIGGFLSTTKIEVSIKPENSREFIGNNPGPCMSYDGKTLISSNCSGSLESLQQHQPATKNLPTYTKQFSGDSEGTSIEGMVETNEGRFVLTSSTSPSSSDSHILFRISDNLLLGEKFVLSDLKASDSYSIESTGRGFLVYNHKLDHILQYSSAGSKPVELPLMDASSEVFSPYFLTVSNGIIVVAHSERSQDSHFDLDEPKAAEVGSEVILYGSDAPKRYILEKRYSQVAVCGENKLCGFIDDVVDVIDLSGKNPVKLFSIGQAQTMGVNASGLMVVKENGVLTVNPDTGSGFVSYSFGGYKYCGVDINGGGYTLCLINEREKKVAVRIKQNKPNKDNIDKKVDNLLDLAAIKDISIYKKHIFITPNYGSFVRNPDTGGFMYDPTTVKDVNKQIKDRLGSSGINRNNYSIKNTLGEDF